MGSEVQRSGLIRTASIGAVLNVLGGLWQTFVRLGASVFLARFLTPTDFGIYGIALLAKTFIGNLGKFGMGASLVATPVIDERDLNTCFWFMAGIRCILFGLALLIAPLAGQFFKEPAVVWPLRAVSFAFIISIFSEISYKILDRNLQFSYIVKVQNIAYTLESLLAVLLAVFTGLQYWSLVIPMLCATALIEVCIVLYAGWFPKMQFDKEKFKYHFYFGRNLLGTNLNTFLQQNIDYLVVGKLFGSRMLGLYEFAYRIPHLFQQKFVNQVKTIILPSLSKVQDANEDLMNAYVHIVRFLSMAAFPALTGLFVLAFPTVDILWGDKWHPVVDPLKVLCFPAMLSCLGIPVQSVFLCKHRPDLTFKLSLLRVAITAVAVILLGKLFGLVGIAFGMLISSLVDILNIYLGFKITDQKPGMLIRAIIPVIFASAVMGILVHFSYTILLSHFSLPVSYILSIVNGLAVFILIYLIIFTSEIARIKKLMRIILNRV